MRAIACREYGPPERLALVQLPSPEPGPGEVVIATRAASVNFPDVLVIADKYQEKPRLPFVPGSEVAGVVKAAGAGVTRFAPGDRVFGIVGEGGFAEECRAAIDRLQPIPEGMDDITAAALTMAYATTHHALVDQANARAGEWLLVLGAAGGVGLAAVEIGTVLGLRVIACASSAEKLELCRRHGAIETIDYTREDLRTRLKAITGGAGVDIVYDAVGAPFTETALRATGWGGRLLVVGFAAGDIPAPRLNLALLMERRIIGVNWGAWVRREPELSRAAIEEIARWVGEGRIRPHIGATYPLVQTPAALRDMLDRRVTGKIVVRVCD